MAFAIALALLRLLLSERLRKFVLDEPNPRSLHTQPIPRTGGIAVLAGTLSGAAWLRIDPSLVAAVVVLMAVSFLDDWRSLGAGLRLMAHLAVSVVFCFFSFQGQPWYGIVAFALILTWMANLYNFMDGADGLAGGMAVIGFGAYAIAAALVGDERLLWFCVAVSVAAAVFLCANFAPARIFLGDTGSVPIGFLAGAIGLLGWSSGVWPAWFPIVVFASFVIDASVTLARRLARGEAFWLPHRSHYYQRLILLGWTHRRLAIVQYGLMSLCAVIALVARGASATVQTALLLLLALGLVGLMRMVDSAWSNRPLVARR